jgi:DNA-directed RNA polymerase specialized sigma24 family protein
MEDCEIPLAHRQPVRKTLTEIFRAHPADAVVIAHGHHDYTLREIAAYCGVHYSTISRRLATLDQHSAE